MSSLTRNGSTRRWRQIRARVLARDNYRCWYCGRFATTVDHLIPRIAGGSDDSSNLVACCRADNLAKGARLLGKPEPPTPTKRPQSREW